MNLRFATHVCNQCISRMSGYWVDKSLSDLEAHEIIAAHAVTRGWLRCELGLFCGRCRVEFCDLPVTKGK